MITFVTPTCGGRIASLMRLHQSIIASNEGSDGWHMVVVDTTAQDSEVKSYADAHGITYSPLRQYPFNLARTLNHGARIAPPTTDVFCFVMDDAAFLCKNVCSVVGQYLHSNPGVGLVTPVEHTNQASHREIEFSNIYTTPGIGPGWDHDLWCYGDIQFYPAAAIKRLHGWNEHLWGYGWTEADMCRRLLLKGYRTAKLQMEVLNYYLPRCDKFWGADVTVWENARILEEESGIASNQCSDHRDMGAYRHWLREVWSPAVWGQSTWKLDLGIGAKREGYTRIGALPETSVDFCWDVAQGIPWPRNSVQSVKMPRSVPFAHVKSIIEDEVRRVLVHGGEIIRE